MHLDGFVNKLTCLGFSKDDEQITRMVRNWKLMFPSNMWQFLGIDYFWPNSFAQIYSCGSIYSIHGMDYILVYFHLWGLIFSLFGAFFRG